MSSSRSKCGLLRELNYNYHCKGCARNIVLVKKESFKSIPMVNITYDMVRVTLDMSVNVWHSVKKELEIKDSNFIKNTPAKAC